MPEPLIVTAICAVFAIVVLMVVCATGLLIERQLQRSQHAALMAELAALRAELQLIRVAEMKVRTELHLLRTTELSVRQAPDF